MFCGDQLLSFAAFQVKNWPQSMSQFCKAFTALVSHSNTLERKDSGNKDIEKHFELCLQEYPVKYFVI